MLLEDTFNFNKTGYIIGVIVTAKVVIGTLTQRTIIFNLEIESR